MQNSCLLTKFVQQFYLYADHRVFSLVVFKSIAQTMLPNYVHTSSFRPDFFASILTGTKVETLTDNPFLPLYMTHLVSLVPFTVVFF